MYELQLLVGVLTVGLIVLAVLFWRQQRRSQDLQQASQSQLQELALQQAQQQHKDAELSALKHELNELQEKFEQLQQSKHQAEKDLGAIQASKQLLDEHLAEHKQQLTSEQASKQQLQEQYQQLSTQHTELKTSLARKEEHFAEQLKQLEDNRSQLSQEFENLANKIFEEKSQNFSRVNQSSIDGLLKPFREQIEAFQKRVNEVHGESLQGNTRLGEEVRKVLDIGLKMSQEASNLTSALKGDSQQRGAWGEAQLRRTLELSGLVEDSHFQAQTSFKDAEGRHKQTDYLIMLPDGKHIIIDSKVTLNAYDRLVAAQTPAEQELAMQEHIKAVRQHIDELAKKDYTNLIGVHSPSFVLMFMPIEPAYIEALKQDKTLFEYGYSKSIILVSHTTLIPVLRTVANLWMLEQSNREAREISERAGDIFNNVCTLAERLAKLGGTLGTVSNHYNSAVVALAGQQGLYGKVERFASLSAKVSKSLPSVEAVHLDYDSQRLDFVVQAITDNMEQPSQLQAGEADE